RPVLGAPGCGRSPKENGFDWVLMRLLAGLKVPREDITGMGVGGLLMEIVTRPQPREEPVHPARNVAALVLAAGRSSRMGGPNKLLAEIGGRPLLRIVVEAALASRARPVIVVTGHQRERVEALDPDKGALIAVPTIDGRRGNPVVWSRRFFPDLMTVEGDIGARHLIGRYSEAV